MSKDSFDVNKPITSLADLRLKVETALSEMDGTESITDEEVGAMIERYKFLIGKKKTGPQSRD